MGTTEVSTPNGSMQIAYRQGSSDEIVMKEMADDNYNLSKLFAKGQHWLDIGANIGIFSLQAASHGAHVEAFEPEKDNYQLLEKNAAQSKQIKIYPLAVTPEGARVRIEHPEDESAHWQVRAIADPKGEPTLALRNLISEGCYIKMDIEGAEHRLILGTPMRAWQKVQYLVLEYHLDRLSLADLVKVKQHLVQAGFDIKHPKITPERYAKWQILEDPFIMHATRKTKKPPIHRSKKAAQPPPSEAESAPQNKHTE